MSAPKRHYTPEQLAFERRCEEKLLAELEAAYAARRIEQAKANRSPIKLRSAIAKTINHESKQMPEDRRDGESHDITDRLLKHFRKNPPKANALAKTEAATPLQQPAADVNSRVQSHPKGGQLPTQDVNQRMQERYKGNPLISAPENRETRGRYPAKSKMSLANQRRLSSLIKSKGVDRELAAETEEERQQQILSERRNRRLGLK